MDRKTLALQRKIDRIKKELASLGELRPGSLSEQYNVCGSPGCRCKQSPAQRHGPYYQVSYTRNGRSSTKFVRRQHLASIKRQLRNYQRLRQLVDEWIETSTELSNLRLEDKTD